MEIKLNKIQSQAVNTIDRNLVLSAGAGTGKTKVLTSRYINILKSKNLKYASEVDGILAITFTKKAAQEMKSRIKKEILNSNDENLLRISRQFPRAQIYTIHGFCNELIRKHSLKIGLNPDYKVEESYYTNKLLEKSLDIIFEGYKNDKRLYDLLVDLKYKRLTSFKNLIKSLYFQVKNKGFSLKSIKEANYNFNKDLKNRSFKKLKELLDDYSQLKTGPKFQNFYEDFKNRDFTYEELPEIEENLGSSKKEDIVYLRDLIKEEILQVKKFLETYNYNHYLFIVEILEKLEKTYKDMKFNENILDYNDLEAMALEILNTGIDLPYKYIMIDEFQDTNPKQIEIIKKITDNLDNNINLFVVGDPKQSIYGFRGGNLKSFRKFLKEMDEKNSLSLEMLENYRSSEKLIESFNNIFSKILRKDYVNLESSEKGQEEIKILKYENNEKLAIANYILDLINNGIDEDSIAVLFRTKKEVELLEKELIKRALNVNNTSKQFSQLREIRDILNILKSVVDEKDILSILSYLKSPMVGLSENSIFIIANHFNREKNLDVKNLSKEDIQLFQYGITKLEYLRNIESKISLQDLIIRIVNEFDFYELSRICYGKNSLSNISKLISLVGDFENNKNVNIRDFIDYINLLELDTDYNTKGINLMTIHKSKGLEFDHVIICDCKRDFSKNYHQSKIEVGEIGLGINLENNNYKHKFILEESSQEDILEEYRLFYVAATRAKKSLTLAVPKYTSEKDRSAGRESSVENSYFGLLESIGFEDFTTLEGREDSYNLEKELFYPKLKVGGEDHKLIREKYIEKNKFLNYYSATAFILYKSDKKSFFDKYILGKEVDIHQGSGLKNSSLEPKIIGDIVHKYAELDPEDIDKFLISYLKAFQVDNSFENIKILKDEIEIYNKMKKGKILEREYEFYYPLKNGILKGYIDQVRQVEDKLELIDIKTGNIDMNISQYEDQLKLYVLAYNNINKIQVDRAKIMSLKDKKEYDVDISRESLENIKMEFEDFIDKVESEFI
ncbi:MAG: UvrD-helicase domain-containing protein [Peptoniphilaceae bacterium]